MRKKSDIGVLLKGDKIPQCGVSRNVYCNVHQWLRRTFGAANKCEGICCSGVSRKFEYALLKGKVYEKKRDNFIMLCHSCHIKYDWDESKHECLRVLSEQTRAKIGLAQKGRKRSQDYKERMSLMMSGKNNPMYGVKMYGEENPFHGKNHSEESKEKMMEAAAQLTIEQVREIRMRHISGEPQKDIAEAFGLNRPRVCKIVNRQIYKTW